MNNFQNYYSDRLIALFQSSYNTFFNHLPTILLALLIIFISLFIGRKLNRIVTRTSEHRSKDLLLSRFLGRITKWMITGIGIILAIYVLGFSGIAGGMIAGAGISAFILGFAFRDIGENFLAGIILAFGRPYNIGDTIEINNYLGNVVSLDIRNTHIKTIDGKDVYIPNSIILKNTLTNYTKDGYLRMNFIAGIDYGENLSEVCKIIIDAVTKAEGVLTGQRKPVAYIEKLTTSTVDIGVYFWIDTFNNSDPLKTKSDVINNVKTELVNNGIVMPADIKELKIYREDAPIPVRITDGDKQNN